MSEGRGVEITGLESKHWVQIPWCSSQRSLLPGSLPWLSGTDNALSCRFSRYWCLTFNNTFGPFESLVLFSAGHVHSRYSVNVDYWVSKIERVLLGEMIFFVSFQIDTFYESQLISLIIGIYGNKLCFAWNCQCLIIPGT